jgi:hypothetical protein
VPGSFHTSNDYRDIFYTFDDYPDDYPDNCPDDCPNDYPNYYKNYCDNNELITTGTTAECLGTM